MPSYAFLSHILSQTTPGFGGTTGFVARTTSSIREGKNSNSQRWELTNHIGTHVDMPRHFIEQGPTVDHFEASQWVFHKPYLWLRPTAPNTLIDTGGCEHIPHACDLLLIKTGFEAYRQTRPYWEQNPGLTPELGQWLKTYRPNVQALGFDFLSASAFQHRDVGREAHRVFLAAPSILLFEDMRLSGLKCTPHRVIALPLRVEGADGSPVTVIAEL